MSTFEKSVGEIRRALLREWRAGVDVGEVLVAGAVAAQRELVEKAEWWDAPELTQNRPGSWEASLLEQILQSGGAFSDGQ